MDTKLIISLLALIISGISLYFSKFQPGKLVGNLSYLVLWRFSSKKDGELTDFKATPAFWLANVGMRPLIVEDIRLSLIQEAGASCNIFPATTVPIEAIETPSEFNEYGRLSLGGPFQGLSLASNQKWVSNYNFHIPQDFHGKLVGPVNVKVEAKLNGNKNWKSVLSEILEFGSEPYHLQPMMVGVEIQSIPVFSKRWKERNR